MQVSDVISLAAAIVALIALAVSIAEVRANRPRLRLGHYLAFGVGGLEGDWLVVSVINWGRQPTTIASLSIEFPAWKSEGRGAKHTPHIPQKIGDSVPHFLEVGREAKFFFPYPSLLDDHPDASQSLHGLAKKYGATALISTTWHAKPLRRKIFNPQ